MTMKLPDTFDVVKLQPVLGQAYDVEFSDSRFRKSYMEFVLTADGWVRVKWDVPSTELLRGMQVNFEIMGKQIGTTARSVDRLAEEMRRWYGPAT